MKKCALLLFPLLLILASCADAGSTQNGYLAADSSGVAFIQFVNNNGQLTGQLQGVDEANGQVHSYNDALTGTLNDGQISLSVSWFGISRVFTGTLDGSNLVINSPGSNGQLETSVFQSATVDDYNNAVFTFESQVQSAQQTVVANQQAVANAQATTNTQSTATVVNATATTTAELQATVSALPANAPYSADSIYIDFANAGLTVNTGESQDYSTYNFNGQTTRPEGGLYDFVDTATGAPMNIATFASTVEIPQYTDQFSSAFTSYTVNNCVLQVENGGSPNTDSYINVMKQYCN